MLNSFLGCPGSILTDSGDSVRRFLGAPETVLAKLQVLSPEPELATVIAMMMVEVDVTLNQQTTNNTKQNNKQETTDQTKQHTTTTTTTHVF